MPKVGEQARDFTLKALDGATVRLSEETARSPIVLVVLRGWPGYQCPFCTRQFGDYLTNAEKFAARGARVLFVYPGPAEDLQAHATAFTDSRPLPANFRILLDPDYTFTNAYGLRWNAPKETAYPSTFVLDRKGTITFAEISREHFSAPLRIFLWLQAEAVAMACDLAEFVGAALGFHLLFGLPLLPAGLLTGVVTFAILTAVVETARIIVVRQARGRLMAAYRRSQQPPGSGPSTDA